MNTGQTLLTLCAMFLLSMIILRVNTNFLMTGDVLRETKVGVVGISLGTSLIEEANSKAFDHLTDTNSVSDVNSLTAAGSLGKETGETTPNDFDDFNNYTRTDSIPGIGVFDINSKVWYVSSSNLKIKSSSRTWNKLIQVTVKNRMDTSDSLVLSSVFSYWFFR